jgi:hypothetical protein
MQSDLRRRAGARYAIRRLIAVAEIVSGSGETAPTQDDLRCSQEVVLTYLRTGDCDMSQQSGGSSSSSSSPSQEEPAPDQSPMSPGEAEQILAEHFRDGAYVEPSGQ